MLDKYREHIAGGFMIFIGAVVLVSSQGIKRMAGIPIGSDFFPRIAAVLLLAFGVFTLLNGMRGRGRGDKAADNSRTTAEAGEVTVETDWKAPLLSIVALGLYVVLLEQIGFLIMTTLYLFAQIVILAPAGKRKHSLFAAIAVAVTALVYLLFVRGLHVMLPAGVLG